MRRITLSLLLCLAAPLSAQEPHEEVPPTVEETIVVTATRSERTVSELPVSTTVVTESELETAPAVTVDDLLRTIPGVNLPLLGSGTHPSTASRLSMHGLGGTRALVLLDGIPMHDPYYGTVEWYKVPVDSLRQIEVVRGGSAGLFGNYALGGTINLLTRPIEQSDLRVDVASGNLDTQRQSLSVDHRMSDKIGIRLGHSRSSSDGFKEAFQPAPVDIGVWSENVISSGRLEYQHSESSRAFIKADWTENGLGSGQPLAGGTRKILDLVGGMHRAAGHNGLLSVSIFRHHMDDSDSDSEVAPDGVSMYRSAASEQPRSAFGGSVEWSTQRSGSIPLVSAGFDFNQIVADEWATSNDFAGVITERKFTHGRQRFAGAFGQLSWQPGERFELLSSVRIDYYQNADGYEETVGGPSTTYPTVTTTAVNPRVSFRHSLGERSAIRGSAYRAFKAPTLRELYRTTRRARATTIGNPDLEPETLIGAELGYEWAVSRARFAVNVYRSDVDGLLVRVPVPGQTNVRQPKNLGTIRSQGIETMADVQLTPRWSVNAGYTYADSIITDDPDPALIGNLVPEVAPHSGSLALRYRSPRGAALEIRGRVLSSSYGEVANVAPSPAHRVFDIAARYPLKTWLEMYVTAENVLDERYYYVLAADDFRATRPRTVLGGVRFHLPARRSDN